MANTIDISKLDKSELLAALYNASKPQGMGFLHFDPAPMTASEAKDYVGNYVDYLKGRVMKVDLRGNDFDPWLYDRDNGTGAAQRVIDALA